MTEQAAYPEIIATEQLPRTRTVEVAAHVGERIRVEGWLHAIRRLGGISFVVVRDGWGTVQAVAEFEAALAPLAESGAGPESIIAVEGIASAAAQAPGGIELREPRISVVVPIGEAPPVALGKRELKAQLGTLLDHAVLTARHPTRRAMHRLGAAAMRGFREELHRRDFTEIQTPKIVAAATESGANVFPLRYFGRDAYLAQSPQLYKQMMVGVFERVYEVGPVFRAEPHDTTRHINEYVSLDVEMGFIRDHREVMALLRDVVAAILAEMRAACAADLDLLHVTLPVVPTAVPSLHFAEAKDLLARDLGIDERDEPDLSPREERALGTWAKETHGSDFLFVEGYPTHKRAFYTHPDPERPGSSRGFDLLFRGVELVSGGQRLHQHADYLAVLAERGLPEEPFAAYLEAFRYGMPPHGGFAIGLERLLMQLTDVPNIRLATLFPRDLTRLTP